MFFQNGKFGDWCCKCVGVVLYTLWLDMSIRSIYSNIFLVYLYLAPCVPCASNDFFSDLPNSSCFNVDWIFSLTCIGSMVSTAWASWLECDCPSPPPRGYKSHKATMCSWATSNNFASFISGTASLCHEGWTPMLVKKPTVAYQCRSYLPSNDGELPSLVAENPWNLPKRIANWLYTYIYIGFYPPFHTGWGPTFQKKTSKPSTQSIPGRGLKPNLLDQKIK